MGPKLDMWKLGALEEHFTRASEDMQGLQALELRTSTSCELFPKLV